MFFTRHSQPEGLTCSLKLQQHHDRLLVTRPIAVQCLRSTRSLTFVPDEEPTNQNRIKWSNLARMREGFQVSERATAAIANSVMQDLGFITDNDKTYVIDRSKLRREQERASHPGSCVDVK